MKAKQPIRRFGVADVTAPTVVAERSNKTALRRMANHVSLICPVCGTSFTRKASEAKRHANNYCGRACAGFASRKQVRVACQMCGKDFTVKQSYVGHVTCCGKECRSKATAERTSAMDIAGWQNGTFARGAKSPGAKLTEEQARKILADTRRHTDIAKDYGISRAAVSHLKRGHTWTHLRARH